MVKTITIVREFDEAGRCVKETRTEVERATLVDKTPDELWTQPTPWWQNPVISYSDGQQRPPGVMVS